MAYKNHYHIQTWSRFVEKEDGGEFEAERQIVSPQTPPIPNSLNPSMSDRQEDHPALLSLPPHNKTKQ